MLTALGLGGSSSGLSLDLLWFMGSPVLLTADSLVGLLCESLETIERSVGARLEVWMAGTGLWVEKAGAECMSGGLCPNADPTMPGCRLISC